MFCLYKIGKAIYLNLWKKRKGIYTGKFTLFIYDYCDKNIV